MKKLQFLLLAFLCFLPQTGRCFTLPFFSLPEKEAQSFVDKSVPEIVARWDETVLNQYVHPDFYKATPRNKVEEFFFSCRMLGPLQEYKAAKGEIMETKTSAGKSYISGRYVAKANFEKATAFLHVSIVKEGRKWMITGFNVDSEAFAAQNKSREAISLAEKEPSTEEMMKTAAAFLREDDIVARRRDVDKIFPIAGRYAAEGDKTMALQLYKEALKAAPANLEQQIEYAKLLLSDGKKEEALAILHLINDMAEDAELLAQNGKMLLDLGLASPSRSSSTVTDAEIVLVPVGNPNAVILADLSSKLQKAMGMTVGIEKNNLPLGDVDRKLKDRYTAAVFQDMSGKISSLQKDAVMKSFGFDEGALQEPLNQSRFLLKIFSLLGAAGEAARKNYEANRLQLGDTGQYNIERLCEEMHRAVPFDKSEKTKVILGVTDKDLFMGKGNFLYGGTSGGAYGVISYFHFTAAANQEKQNRPRLVSRLLKQALSSANFALGIPRCNTPYCARSFPQSIAEHDAKGEELCSECKRRLESYKKDPRSDTSDFEYCALGEKYRTEKKWDLAATLFKKVIDHNATRAPEAIHHLGVTYMDQGRYAEADGMFRRYFDASADDSLVAGKDIPAAIEVGNSFYLLGQLSLADHYFSRVLATDGENISALVFKGYFYMRKGDDGTAEKFFRRALEIDPDGFFSNIGMASYLEDKNKTADVVKHYEKSLINIPKDVGKDIIVKAHYNLGVGYLALGETDKAIEQLNKALVVNPSFVLAYNNLGIIYGKSGRLDKATSTFKQAIEIKPDFADVWNSLGYTYYQKKEYCEAISSYEKALQFTPDSGLTHYNKALAHAALQEFQQAIHHADRASELGYAGNRQFHQNLSLHRK